MAETLISPGVLARENDQSQITSQPVQAGAAIVGPTVKGKVSIPTIVTTYSEYLAEYGSTFTSASDEYTFLTSTSAYNYFQNGGTSLLVTRVASGSFTVASSSTIYNAEESGVLTIDAGLSDISTNSTASVTGTTGSLSATTGGSGTSAVFSIVKTSGSIVTSITATGGGSGYEIGDTLTFASASIDTGADVIVTLAATDIINDNAFVLETLAEGDIMNSTGPEGSTGALDSGSTDNIRWEIVNPNTDQGTFSLIIRQGNDRYKSKSVLETFTNVSLDPKSSNYITKVIGDQVQTLEGAGTSSPYISTSGNYPNASRYIRVASVNAKTTDYFDNAGLAKTAFTASIPTAQSGTFGSADGSILTGTGNYYDNIDNTDTQGLVGDNYTDVINLLANKDSFRYNIITTPGLIYENATHATPLNALISNTENRGDAIVVLDLKNYAGTVTGTTSTAASLDTSYAAAYWPWLQITEVDSQQLVWVPASAMIPGVYAYTDKTSEAWFAPAGINRGGLGTVRQAERKLDQPNRDILYTGKVNPIATFPGRGVVVFGQKTLQNQSSALDRVNVRRLLITLKGYISQISDNLVFEQNTASTRNTFLSQVNPYLESVQQRQGLYAFKVVMDDTNNTADVIDRNELVGAIYLQPTKTAEYIYLDFNILPTGAVFPS
jgi:uncharacterized protein